MGNNQIIKTMFIKSLIFIIAFIALVSCGTSGEKKTEVNKEKMIEEKLGMIRH